MQLTVQLFDSSSNWSVEAQPQWNALFLKRLACVHFDIADHDNWCLSVANDNNSDGDFLDNNTLLSDAIATNARILILRRLNSCSSSNSELWVYCHDCDAAAVADEIQEQLQCRSATNGTRLHPIGRCVPLPDLVGNRQQPQLDCCVCECPLHPLILFGCGHAACVGCFVSDARTRLRRGAGLPFRAGVGASVECPGVGCRSELRFLRDVHTLRLLGREDYEFVKAAAAERALMLSEAGWLVCPRRECGLSYELPEQTNPEYESTITCDPTLGGCGAKICTKCRRLAHAGDCNSLEEIGDKAEVESLRTVSRVSKPCPKCRSPTQRNGGCMHIVCSVCSTDWCWLCADIWRPELCQAQHWFG